MRPPKADRRAVLAFAALAGAFWVGIILKCLPSAPAENAAIESLFKQREAYLGKRVRVAGRVKLFLEGEEKEHFVIESADAYRVGIRGIKKPKLNALRGRDVKAEGVFDFTEDRGAYLDKPDLTPLD